MSYPHHSNLNLLQKEAVESIGGPVLIIAGPGSGKTRVITSRIAHLVKECEIAPHRIGALTFTNKAANEMKERLLPLLGEDAKNITAGTFHSFCASILRRDGPVLGLDRNFIIFDDDDQMKIIKDCMKEHNIDPKRFTPRGILSTISNAKSLLIDSKSYNETKADYYQEIVSRVFLRYEEILNRSEAVDFDDLLLKTHTILTNHHQVGEYYRERFLHLMIDEFQDTNISQYAIAKQITSKHRNLCVVGDPDQSIYSWRNADIRNILSFNTDFSDAQTITLEENYRSTKTILEGAKVLISKNTDRVEKDLWTKNLGGNLIPVLEGFNEENETDKVLREVGKLLDSKEFNLSDICIMYRVNAQSRSFEMGCQRYGIPYQLIGGVKFYQRREIKDLTAYLRLLLNYNDDVSFTRVVNVPPRGVGQRTLGELSRISRTHNISLFQSINAILDSEYEDKIVETQLGPRAIKSLSAFRDLIWNIKSLLQTQNIVEIIDTIISETGYRKLFHEDEKSEERFENIQEYRSSAEDYLHMDHIEALTAFLENIALVSDLDSMSESSENITLITLHQAKGLEYPAVFITGMEDGLLPHIKSIESGEPSELEEERRLFYVGMTRAEKRLYLSRSFRRNFWGGSEPSAPSRFISEIPRKLLQITEKESVSHKQDNARSGYIKPTKKSATPSSKKTEAAKPLNNLKATSRSRVKRNSRKSKELNPTSLPNLNTGDKIRHHIFGDGIIINTTTVNSDIQLTVAFDKETGIKKLLASIANLKKLPSK